VIVAVSVVAIASVLSILSGYAFGLMRFRGASILFYVFLLGLMVPMEAMIVPLYFDLRDLHLTDTYWALILPQVAQSVAFGTFWMRSYFTGTPRSLIDAGRIDGASSWGILWRILVPSGRPAITTMVVITFMWTWNEFLLALVMVSSENRRTVPLGLAFFQGQHSSDISLLAAAAVLVALPVVVVYLVFQRRFIEGMLSGAIKE
jgi:raffinose/stachyose/melibiose transport system permease protein